MFHARLLGMVLMLRVGGVTCKNIHGAKVDGVALEMMLDCSLGLQVGDDNEFCSGF